MSSNHNDPATQNSNLVNGRNRDTLGDIAIQAGTQQVSSGDIEVSLEISNSEASMLKELASSLGLAIKIVAESAIMYVYFCVKKQGLSVEQLPKYSQSSDYSLKLTLALETIDKLDKLGMTQKLSECVVTGIRLLYIQLIETVSVKV